MKTEKIKVKIVHYKDLFPRSAKFFGTLNSNYGAGKIITFRYFFVQFEGLVNEILSAGFWIPLSRLTYCAYLVHPIVIMVLYGSFETVQAYSDVYFVSNICLCLIVMSITVSNINLK